MRPDALETRPRIFLVDDCVPLTTALARLLRRDCDVVGCARTIAELLAQLNSTQPDVILLDVMLPDGSGIDSCRQLKTAMPNVRIVFLTAMCDADVRSAAIGAGAADLISKFAPHAQLLAAIRNSAL